VPRSDSPEEIDYKDELTRRRKEKRFTTPAGGGRSVSGTAYIDPPTPQPRTTDKPEGLPPKRDLEGILERRPAEVSDDILGELEDLNKPKRIEFGGSSF
jgi:hypothetical protein